MQPPWLIALRASVGSTEASDGRLARVGRIDLITSRTANLYRDLLDLLGETDPSSPGEMGQLYAATCRSTRNGGTRLMETWMQPPVHRPAAADAAAVDCR